MHGGLFKAISKKLSNTRKSKIQTNFASNDMISSVQK